MLQYFELLNMLLDFNRGKQQIANTYDCTVLQ